MYQDFDDEEQQGWWRRNATGLATLIGSLGVVVGLYYVVSSLDQAKPTAPPLPTIVELRPPPPPPPPPPEVEEEPPPEIEEEEIVEPEPDEPQPLDEPPESIDEPPSSQLGLDAEGSGSGDAFGLVGQKGGARLGRGGVGGDVEQWYRGVAQLGVSTALRRHPKLRFAEYPLTPMHLWVDSTGRIVQVKLLGSTGDPEIDRVLESEVLAGVTLRKPPPAELLNGPGGQLRITVRTTAIAPETG